MVYQPAEDSVLLAKAVNKFAKGKVLEMGTGSGFLSHTAAKKEGVDSVLGVDVDAEAVAFAKKNVKHEKVSFHKSDLFSNITGEFDTIIFNPPYLPNDQEFHDIALHGGKRGYETINAFISQVGDYLSINGKLLLLFSSHSRPDKIQECLTQHLFEYKEYSSQHIMFEDLYVYVIKKTKEHKMLHKKGVTSLSYLAKGKRGVVYTGMYHGKKVAVKIKKEESTAINRMENEAKWLDHLRNTGMCPKLLFSGKNYLCYEYVWGEFLPDFLLGANKKEALFVLKEVLAYCRALDKLGVNKQEMTRPIKHILVNKQKVRLSRTPQLVVTMIDWERARFVKSPSNVTQFVQYLTKDTTKKLIKDVVNISSKITGVAQTYKKQPTDVHYEQILSCIS